ncbi:MAG: hypothetical protein IKO07_06320 [Clostridia bacterium]|nr:hypothetical protein [Clostridia bacterium]
MAKDNMTDEEVELEIERLKESPAVKLAQREYRYKHKRQQYLNTLRWQERRGKYLMAHGITEADFKDQPEMDEWKGDEN